MAGNRIHKFGTILTRVEGLLKSGAMAEESKPLWLDVYRAFPPNIEPKLSRPTPDQHIRDVLYPEDYIRARFYDTFGSVGGIIDNLNQMPKNYKTVSQTFIDRFIELARSDPNLSEDELFNKTTNALFKDGVRLKTDNKSVAKEMSKPLDSRPKKPSVSEMVLSDD